MTRALVYTFPVKRQVGVLDTTGYFQAVAPIVAEGRDGTTDLV